MQQSSQLIQSNKISKPLLKDDLERLAQSGKSTSQRGIKQGLVGDRELSDLVVNQPQTNNTAHPPITEEINQLARSWCELMLGQMQENTINRN